ncbi:hypothetical protein [Methanocella arvoryzae]|nr:hypothetical protein [Methanocella arvoryzae]
MQVFREKPRTTIEISVRKSREMDAANEKAAIIDPHARFLPLDDCEMDDY